MSETGFAVKICDNPCTYELRWFSPVDEVDLCGHCTLGTAFILFSFYEQEETTIHFNALMAGHKLTVSRKGELLTLDFPAVPPETIDYSDYDGLGATPVEALKTYRDLMLVFQDADSIRNMNPDFEKLKKYPIGQSVYVTARSDNPAYDIVARAFWPKLGINEDPVCGSMHTTLIPYWSKVLGKTRIISRELSPRGGTLYCEMAGQRVKISGKCKLYLIGKLMI